MKQLSDLHIPFQWSERRAILLEKCLYLPQDCEPGGEATSPFFEREQPLAVEYCSGNGQWIAAKALQFPGYNWIAVEYDFYRARKIWLKIFRQNLSNLFVVCGEALRFTRSYLRDQSVEQAYVRFPDPWPKRRHAKHRLVQPAFVHELSRVFSKEGSITLVTDDLPTSERMKRAFSSWKSAYPAGATTEDQEEPLSYFHALWKTEQRTIFTHRFFPCG